MKLIQSLLIVLLLILVGCKNPVDPGPALICEVAIEINDSELEVGDSTQVIANVSSPNGSTCNSGVSWKVDNEGIISITKIDESNASIKALEKGNVSVTAESIDDSEAFSEVSVSTTFSIILLFHKTYGGQPGNTSVLSVNSFIKDINEPSNENGPAQWLPDGDHISISSTRNRTNSHIFVMDLENNEVHNVTPNLSIVLKHLWLPDGETIIATIKPEMYSPYEIYTFNTRTKELNRLTFENIVSGRIPAASDVSNDGKKVLYQSNKNRPSNIYSMNIDGSNKQQLTYSTDYGSISAKWSPDGRKIIFSYGENRNRNIFVMNSDGSNSQPLTNTVSGISARDATWRPDGKAITFFKWEAQNSLGESWIMNSDGSNKRPFMSHLKENDYIKFFSFDWRPGIDIDYDELNL